MQRFPASALAEGQTATVRVNTHCGVTYLDLEIAGSYWVARDPGSGLDWVPEPWEDLIDNEERIELALTLVSATELEAVAVGEVQTRVVYVPTDERVGCD